MEELGAIFQSAMTLLPPEAQAKLFAKLAISKDIEAAPAGAILMGMHVLEYLGFSRYVDEFIGEEHTSIEQLKKYYQQKVSNDKPMVPSSGIVLSLLVADMVACPRRITRAYKFEETAVVWQTGPLLGIEPNLLNDDRIGNALDLLGIIPQTMEEILQTLVIDASKRDGLPLNRFILDTTVLQLDGEFNKAPKVCPGRGKDSFSQLVNSLVIASGSRIPVSLGVLPGNTSDSKALPDAYSTINKIADDGAIELLFDRAFPTAGNILYLKNHEHERMVYWVAPLKMGLSEQKVRELIQAAWGQGLWQPITYRSTKESRKNIAPPLTAFESTWTLRDIIKPDLEPGQKRRPKGAIQTVEIDVRCVFYRHEVNAASERQRRLASKMELDGQLQKFILKLNQRKYRKLDHCQRKLDELLNQFANVKKFVDYTLCQNEKGVIFLNWSWDESAMSAEEKFDGIFALLTNYAKERVNQNSLVKKYRGRDQVEVDFKDFKGILDLERIIYQLPQRIDAYLFLKIVAYFVLAFLRVYAGKAGVKTTERTIQESMGDMILVEGEILPLGIKTYSVGRDSKLNKILRNTFDLPEPTVLIKILNEAVLQQIDARVLNWYESVRENGRDSP